MSSFKKGDFAKARADSKPKTDPAIDKLETLIRQVADLCADVKALATRLDGIEKRVKTIEARKPVPYVFTHEQDRTGRMVRTVATPKFDA